MRKKMNPLVSIVIPVYNREKAIVKLLDALSEQIYSNLEIICVDDGSRDHTVDVVEKYKKKDDRIVLIQKENGGAVSAVCQGIRQMKGEYICFIDSDDLVGTDFIQNFIDQLDECYDFVAFGFYYENGILKSPYNLKETRVYKKEDLNVFKSQVLIEHGSSDISNRFFISRWNKIYSRKCIMKILPEYEKCIGVTLGEDSIFNHLLIRYAESGKTIKDPNSYYYDVGDGDSVMRSKDYSGYFEKCRRAYSAYNDVLAEDNMDNRQALYVMYYHVSAVFNKAMDNADAFDTFFAALKHDKIYNAAVRRYLKDTQAKRQKVLLNLFLVAPSGKSYRSCLNAMKNVKSRMRKAKKIVGFVRKNLPSKGIKKTKQLWVFQQRRENAHQELKDALPTLEKRVNPILEKFAGQKTNLNNTPIEKNIFVFWWDGFETAPQLVKECLLRTKQMFPDAKIIEISKHNFEEYTTIHPELIRGFREDKISIQTFSDILRYNLLKNHGGMWVDSTIFFTDQYDMFEMLGSKSYESLAFKETEAFMEYKGVKCSWSSYLQAARKGAVIVEAMNNVFEEYYLTYGDYGIYFFMDAALMLCKLQGVDDGALDKVHYCEGSAFSLSAILSNKYDHVLANDVRRLPQKLFWWYQPKKDEQGTFYTEMFCHSHQSD